MKYFTLSTFFIYPPHTHTLPKILEYLRENINVTLIVKEKYDATKYVERNLSCARVSCDTGGANRTFLSHAENFINRSCTCIIFEFRECSKFDCQFNKGNRMNQRRKNYHEIGRQDNVVVVINFLNKEHKPYKEMKLINLLN